MHLNIELFKLKQRLMKSYPQLVFCVPKMRNVSEIVYDENWIGLRTYVK